MSLSFQQLILNLHQFWANQGCVILQPYDMEVGAGTFHPATALRALGPDAWNAAYVQPSRRPKDGRYGENPNRLQHYYQYQVIMKPSPPNFQELYLESLRMIGIDPAQHDIRFVEDDWESPTLGAWGLGWEVWCDGMEVTQFTYFQQVGGIECKPVSGEITYGLERLAMYIQGKENVYDLQFNGIESRVESRESSKHSVHDSSRSTLATVTYGDIFLQNEKEFSAYNLEFADTKQLLRQFEDAENECQSLLAKNLPLPAYDQCIKASHRFNLLDARGVISVTERAAYIARVRALAKGCCEAYVRIQGSEIRDQGSEKNKDNSSLTSGPRNPGPRRNPMTLEFYIVDAFTEVAFRGNAAAVVMLDAFPDDADMQRIALQMYLSETAFVVPRKTKLHYDLRWFTPETEVKLCGHATLATAHILLQTGAIENGDTVIFHTLSGELSARAVGKKIELDFPTLAGRAAKPHAALKALGVDIIACEKNRDKYLVEVKDFDTLVACAPHFKKLAKMDALGVIVTTARGVTANTNLEKFDFASRYFAPGIGIDEDPVTGSSHCFLAPYWAKKLGKKTFHALQASKGYGILDVTLKGERTLISGHAVTTLKGQLPAKTIRAKESAS